MRTLKMKIRLRVFLALAALCAPLTGFAQPGKLELENLDKLSAKATVVNDVTLDGALLQLAAKVLDASHDEEAAQVKEVIKGLKGIYVKNFEFDEPNQYSPADVEAIRSQLARPGWSRVVESRDKRHGENSEIYLLKEGDKIAAVAILVAEPKELTVVNIVGFIDLDKLGELGGKFGIPEEIKDKTDKPKNKPSTQTKPDKKESAYDENDHDEQ